MYADYSPLARLSLDKRLASNVTRLGLFATSMKLLPGTYNHAMDCMTPCGPMSKSIAHSLMSFPALEELQLVLNSMVQLCAKFTDEWEPEYDLVPFQLCHEGGCEVCEPLSSGLVRKGQVEWGPKGVENCPVIKFVCLEKKENIEVNDIEGSDG